MLPQDPFILFSYVNTQLRDNFSTLEALCDDAGVSVEDVVSRLEKAGFQYDPEQHQFRSQRNL